MRRRNLRDQWLSWLTEQRQGGLTAADVRTRYLRIRLCLTQQAGGRDEGIHSHNVCARHHYDFAQG